MIDYVLASGCSWTEGYRTKGAPQPHVMEDEVWPAVLAKMLDVPYRNVGLCGQGNLHIYNSLNRELAKKDGTPLVVPMWSECTRFALPKNRKRYAVDANDHPEDFGYEVIRHLDKRWDTPGQWWESKDRQLFLNIFVDLFSDIAFLLHQSYSWYLWLQNTCDAFGYPYLASQGLNIVACNWPSEVGENTDFNAAFEWNIKHGGVVEHIDTDTFINWAVPELKEDIDFTDWAELATSEPEEFWTHSGFEKDIYANNFIDRSFHPTHEGHEWIAEQYYNRYKEIYV